MKRRAQMKMMETILVLIVFFFLLAFSIGFYIKFSAVMNKNRNSESQELEMIRAIQRVKSMPELHCNKISGEQDNYDCFDIYKMKAFKAESSGNARYTKIYPNMYINITQIYPEGAGGYNDTIYDNNPGSKKYSEAFMYYMPVAMYDPITDSKGFGYATVGFYR